MTRTTDRTGRGFLSTRWYRQDFLENGSLWRLDFFAYFVLLWRLVEFLRLHQQWWDFLPHLHVNNLETLEQPLGISILTFTHYAASHPSGTYLVPLVTLTGDSWQLSPKCCQQLLTLLWNKKLYLFLANRNPVQSFTVFNGFLRLSLYELHKLIMKTSQVICH